jgi:hypothetical protein
MTTDHETPWKELLEHDAERFLAFFYPDVHADLDWARDVEWLEQEFRKLAPESVTGKRVVDKLLKLYQRGTGDARYLHVEIQSYFDAGFERRVYVYNSRAEDRFGQPVASLVILIDDDPAWLPTRYESELYGTTRALTFRMKKIIRERGREAELEGDANPVGLFVLAFLEGRRLDEKDFDGIAAAKARVMRGLKKHRTSHDETGRWLGLFDWFLQLPPGYNARLWREASESDKENVMPLVSYLEQVGIEKGMEKGQRIGLVKAIALGLDLKFDKAGLALMPAVEKIEDLTVLEAIKDAIKPAASLDDVSKLIPASEAPG